MYSNVIIGKTYLVRIGPKSVPVTIRDIFFNLNGKRMHYVGKNLNTNREVIIRSSKRIKEEITND